jgi:hypothetical protein
MIGTAIRTGRGCSAFAPVAITLLVIIGRLGSGDGQ